MFNFWSPTENSFIVCCYISCYTTLYSHLHHCPELEESSLKDLRAVNVYCHPQRRIHSSPVAICHDTLIRINAPTIITTLYSHLHYCPELEESSLKDLRTVDVEHVVDHSEELVHGQRVLVVDLLDHRVQTQTARSPDLRSSGQQAEVSGRLDQLEHVVTPGHRKEGNVLFNDTLNTFYLRLYGVRHG